MPTGRTSAASRAPRRRSVCTSHPWCVMRAMTSPIPDHESSQPSTSRSSGALSHEHGGERGAEATALGQLNHARSLPQRGSVRDCA